MSAGYYSFAVRIDCAIRVHFEAAPTSAEIVELVTAMVNDGVEEHFGVGTDVVVALTGGPTPK